MKNVLIIISIVLLFSCNENNISYTTITTNQFNEMTSPVVLISKSKSMGSYSVTLIDSSGTAYTFGNVSRFADGIGINYNIGDTLK